MLYLASRSPQRAKLLADAGIAHVVVDSSADEDAIQLPHPQALALERARRKAEEADLSGQTTWQDGDAVLAADTVVSLGQVLLGKPHNDDEARAMLRQLSGTSHVVTTAQCIHVPQRNGGNPVQAVGVSMARVTMRELSDADIDDYVASGESRGRAGAYAIQETGDRFITDREGDFDTVVGLHVATVHRLYHEATGLTLDGRGAESLP